MTKLEIVRFEANPGSVEKGQSFELNWDVTNAAFIRILPEIGSVASEGRKELRLDQDTTYEIVAAGPAGEVRRKLVMTLRPTTVSAVPKNPRAGELGGISITLEDVYFDYNSSAIRERNREILDQVAEYIKKMPAKIVTIEGHCDERGSAEYNMGVGDRRANSVREYLVSRGIPPQQLKTVSYGKELPVCSEATEECWEHNRRVHFVAEDETPAR
jgi:peptidoglycan-associated lipoprotein